MRGSGDKIKQMLAMMMTVALLPEAEASGNQVALAGQVDAPTSSGPSYLFLFVLMIGAAITWEFLKGVIACRMLLWPLPG